MTVGRGGGQVLGHQGDRPTAGPIADVAVQSALRHYEQLLESLVQLVVEDDVIVQPHFIDAAIPTLPQLRNGFNSFSDWLRGFVLSIMQPHFVAALLNREESG